MARLKRLWRTMVSHKPVHSLSLHFSGLSWQIILCVFQKW
uniref:Uncharacterized protein n=1 Tax=Anguilla anguilla TaxID=7936 RepID=A0A0E9TKI3_ANGAN